MKQSTDQTRKVWAKLINHAVSNKPQKSFNVSLELSVNGQTWKAYGAEVSHRDILFYCDKGTVTFLVDSYGDRHVTELFDYEESA